MGFTQICKQYSAYYWRPLLFFLRKEHSFKLVWFLVKKKKNYCICVGLYVPGVADGLTDGHGRGSLMGKKKIKILLPNEMRIILDENENNLKVLIQV